MSKTKDQMTNECQKRKAQKKINAFGLGVLDFIWHL